ncbi:hypothetical protein AHiyo8_24120 [Arthrobacter sp. Hiyo8]|nr:hypothetical protein AHiyo8_24120 [Arthrobacter sp. Hiyo8]
MFGQVEARAEARFAESTPQFRQDAAYGLTAGFSGANNSIRTPAPSICARTVNGPRSSGESFKVITWEPGAADASENSGADTWDSSFAGSAWRVGVAMPGAAVVGAS